MPRKPKEQEQKEKEQLNQTETSINITEGATDISPVLGSTIDKLSKSTSATNLVGKIISLDLRKDSYFGVGNIWLTQKNYWAKIPAGLTPAGYDVIRRALQSGLIVLGKKYIPQVEKNKSTIEDYWKLIQSSRNNGSISKDTIEQFKNLLKKKTTEGWTVTEVVAYCKAKERESRNREHVLTFLKSVEAMYEGPLSLTEEPSDQEGIKNVPVTDNVEPYVHKDNSAPKNTGPQQVSPQGRLISDSALKSLLG